QNYELSYAETNDPNPVYKTVITSATATDIKDLNPGTSYTIRVRTICDDLSGQGAMSIIRASTQCNSTTVPYTEDFENAVLPNLPTCTSSINMSKGPYNWLVKKMGMNGFFSNTLVYNSDLYTDADAWFFTKGIALTE